MYYLAFITGLFGSLHCLGMCGPLALGIPSYLSGWALVWGKISYNMGRILTYSILGLVLGLIGKRLWIPELQSQLSIGIGILVLIWAIFRILAYNPISPIWGYKILVPIQNGIQYALKHKFGNLWIGILNGILPCGMVYLALAGALNTLSPVKAGLYMASFGFGTFPLMLMASLGSGWLNPQIRKKLNHLIPYFILFMGLWFLFRGIHLDIPYLSPGKLHWGISFCH